MGEGRASSLVRLGVAFAGWAAVGVLVELGVASLLLPLLLVCFVAAAVLLWLLLWQARDQWVGLSGLVLGSALPVAYIGWLNRGGPGTVCVRQDGGFSCTDAWAPWPFYLVAALLACASFGLCAYLRRVERARDRHGGAAL